MAKPLSHRTPSPPSERFPIVGVGSSAGGFDALRRLLQAMPDQPGLAIVIVQHLARDKPSLAPELLSKHTKMEVRQVHDEPVIRPNHVYVIPPGKYLSIHHGQLQLSNMEGPRSTPIAIDFFLRALAKDQHQRAVGVILSGTGSDGTLGVKAIKQAGGLVLAQDPATAEHSGMPDSAIASGAVDQVLAPEEIPAALIRFAEHDYIQKDLPAGEDSPAGTVARGDAAASAASGAGPLHSPPARTAAASTADPSTAATFGNDATGAVDDAALAAVIDLLRKDGKRDFRNYKEATLLRRTRRRMCLRHIDTIDDYVELLKKTPKELEALAKDLLISVTDFFRDRESWQELAARVIPEIVQSRLDEEPIRVWIAGCATGEEAYTAAILMMEELTKQHKHNPLQIFASDIDHAALQYARSGRYPSSIVADVSPQRIKRFFTLESGGAHFHVNKTLRESVIFADQDMLVDPPFSRLDLVCCRNVMIYLKADVQQKLITLFHFALRQGGYLLLGVAETIGRQDDLFATVSKRHRIYRSVGSACYDRLSLSLTRGAAVRDTESFRPPHRNVQLTRLAQQKLIDRLAPRAILVDRYYRIMFISGDVNPYLLHKAGVPNDDLLRKARRGLRSKLRVAVHKAFTENKTVRVDCLIEDDSARRRVSVEVSLVHTEDHKEQYALVVFQEVGDAATAATSTHSGAPGSACQDTSAPPHPAALDAPPSALSEAELDESTIIRQLEEELAATRDDLQSTIEQYETSNEEFKASTEEVMSVNEELQSTNEELETSKEELQSLNEELSTVNLQLAAKVEELELKHTDLENLISATEVATVCLDTDLAIRWFTPAAQQLIRIKPTDHGRPLNDLQNDFVQDDLIDECRRVLEHLVPIDSEVDCTDGRAFIRRVVPYRTDDHRIGGVVITLLDITSRRKREEDLLASKEELSRLNKTLENQVSQRTQLLEVLQYVTRVANEGRTVDAAMREALDKITHYNGWRVGHVWRLDQNAPAKDFTDPDAAHRSRAMISSGIWHFHGSLSQPTDQLRRIQQQATQTRCAHAQGIVGKVLESGQAQWVEDIATQPEATPWPLAELGLHAAIAFPVKIKDDVVAVMEFFSDQVLQPETSFLEIMPDIGLQLGHLIERKRLEQVVAEIANEEQRRIGRELHDGIAQQLTGGALIAESLRRSLPQEASLQLEYTEHLIEILHQTHADVRQLSNGLMPDTVDATDLLPSLRKITAEVTDRFAVPCSFEAQNFPEGFITNDVVAYVVYQVAREALHNAVKHAAASRIVMSISAAQDFCLTVQDDGAGFEPGRHKSNTNGMRIMRYRAESVGGELNVESVAGEGSRVVLTIPSRSCR